MYMPLFESLAGSSHAYHHDTKKIAASVMAQGLSRKKTLDIWTHFTFSQSEHKTQFIVISEEIACGFKLLRKKTSKLKSHLKV